MKIPDIESILSQEMEEIIGGEEAACHCPTGAYQGSGDGDCYCQIGGAAQVVPSPPTTCTCTNGAGQP